MKLIKQTLNGLAFVLTILMVLYGLYKGFDTLELMINILYFSVIIITTFIALLEQVKN